MRTRAQFNIRRIFDVASHAYHVVINPVSDAVFKCSADIPFLSRAFNRSDGALVFRVSLGLLTDGLKRPRLCAFQLCQKRRAVVDQISRHCVLPSISPTPHRF